MYKLKITTNNLLKFIRSAINRSKDIVRDKEVKSANHTLDGMTKARTKTGASGATNHKSDTNPEDLEQFFTYFLSAPCNPIVFLKTLDYLIRKIDNVNLLSPSDKNSVTLRYIP